jgi:hypothetical protein
MKIAFHDNAMSLFGTTLALYNWAYWGREYLDIQPIIMYNSNHVANNISVIDKFKNTFNNKVFSYSNHNQIDNILSENQCEYFFMEKGGKPDGVVSTVSKNLINAISVCDTNDIHGDVFAMGSEWLSKITDYEIPYVPYIVTLPEGHLDLRNELNIPNDAFVFGRNGGFETFDISFVKEAIMEIIDQRKDIWFLFQCTQPFITHERVIYLPSSTDPDYKVKFINSCDVMLHARSVGESFGMACGEFSIKNKPVITWNQSRERSHIDILNDKGIFYNNKNDIINILLNITKKDIVGKDWNAYTDYSPEKVMKKFKEIYLR